MRALAVVLFGLPALAHAALAPAVRAPAMLLVLLVYAGFCGVIAWRHRARQRPAEVEEVGDWTVVHASQTGYAELLAQQTQAALQHAGLQCGLLPLATLDAGRLLALRRVLFVVSTTGEGDAPDTAAAFVTRIMQLQPRLDELHYGVLALGDRSYRQYCAFGYVLDRWLQQAGAHALFDLVEVDNGDPAALRHWQQQLAAVAGHVEIDDWAPPDYQEWPLLERQLLNPGSAGDPLYLVALQTPVDASWQAGDLVEIGPAHDDAALTPWLADLGLVVADPVQRRALARRQWPESLAGLQGMDVAALLAALPPLPHREYSIASLPEDGRLELVVRQQRDNGGRLGMGSGWLTEHARIGGAIAVRVRENRGFHGPAADVPLILIGNGSGIAGLRAHLKARAAQRGAPVWLLFGERNAAHDAVFADELAAWQHSGVLARLDLVYSRDGEAHEYVQHRLQQQGALVRDWIAQGAAILVCGSLAGMAGGVADSLKQLLGDDTLAELAAAGRYRRDVY
ncbi:sulfite reductase subunit alpha [Chitinolyticbacter meiyuanensis]|uniref:sulfite reductase subunit alpha n=1 Tax=Chitinolyticbacter meiyuanensis TaxID=682798 RepID=UPI0011E58A0E|nr:sulfite reductase subunit alpha [Chitinolyticbacter meiyuanensis]